MPTGQNKTGKHGGAGSRANRYKQLLLDQGVDPKTARAMTKDRYDDLSPYIRETRTGNKEKIPITSSEIVEMEKMAERQAKEYKSSGKYVSPERREEKFDIIRGRHLAVRPEREYEYKKKEMIPSKTLESSGTVRPVVPGSGSRGGGGGGAMPDVDKLGKNPLNMAKGGLATRGYGLARRPAKKVVKLAVTKKR